jgi:drug/metabolite transporter (DMT)-like permease
LKKVRAANASILGLIEPLSAVIFSIIILHDSISIPVMMGGALILAGGAIVTREQ